MTGELRTILSSSVLTETLEKQGIEPLISTPGQFTAMIEAKSGRGVKLINATNIKPNQLKGRS